MMSAFLGASEVYQVVLFTVRTVCIHTLLKLHVLYRTVVRMYSTQYVKYDKDVQLGSKML